jgi:RHS repeat-associated protein
LKVSTTATWTYGWDNMNQLVGVKQVTATGTQLSVSYSYDVLGKRVEDDTWKPGTGTVTVRHAYDGNNIWADVTTTNTLLARYVYGDGVDQVWARAIPAGLTNSGVAWYLTDREGSVRDIMDSSSVIQDHIDYDGYGNPTHTTISFADRFGYTGGLYSYETKMEQFGARWYDPASGRWVSEDPSGFGGGDQNLYWYVGNESTNATDPSGLRWHLLNGATMDMLLPDGKNLADLDAEAAPGAGRPYTSLLGEFRSLLNEKWNDGEHLGIKIPTFFTLDLVVWDVKVGENCARLSYLPIFFQWDLVPDDPKEPLPVVLSKELRTLILNGTTEFEDKLFERPFQVGKSRWVEAFQLKKKTPEGKPITRIVFFDAPGGASDPGGSSSFQIKFFVRLQDAGDDRPLPFTGFGGTIKRTTAGSTLRWQIFNDNINSRVPVLDKEVTKPFGSFPPPK